MTHGTVETEELDSSDAWDSRDSDAWDSRDRGARQ